MLLDSSIARLIGVSVMQVRYSNPKTLDQALRFALSVQEAERLEKFSESYYTSFDNSLRLDSPSPSRYAGQNMRSSADTNRAVDHTQSQRSTGSRSDKNPSASETRNPQTKKL
jgi:hypothetical protein